jgi:precorrin-2 dehydrogenase/sirohydrochlorin ferrochelatase
MGKQYYAAFLDLENKPVTVIGAGHEAEGKVRQLLPTGARVTLIAPEATDQVQRWVEEGKLTWVRRTYQPGDLEGAHLAIVGTDDHEVNHRAADEARARRVLVNTVDDVAYCDFIAPALVKQGDLTVAISTGGGSPAMARYMRELMESILQPWYADMLDALSEARTIIRGRGKRPDTELWQDCIDEEFTALVQRGEHEAAVRRMVEMLDQCGRTASGCWCQTGADRGECAARRTVQLARKG